MPDRPPHDESDHNDLRRDAPGIAERPARESDRPGSDSDRDRTRSRPQRPPLTERERRERWPIG